MMKLPVVRQNSFNKGETMKFLKERNLVLLHEKQYDLILKIIEHFAPNKQLFDRWYEVSNFNGPLHVGIKLFQYGEDGYWIVQFRIGEVHLLLSLIDCLTDETVPDFTFDEDNQLVRDTCSMEYVNLNQHLWKYLNEEMLPGLNEK